MIFHPFLTLYSPTISPIPNHPRVFMIAHICYSTVYCNFFTPLLQFVFYCNLCHACHLYLVSLLLCCRNPHQTSLMWHSYAPRCEALSLSCGIFLAYLFCPFHPVLLFILCCVVTVFVHKSRYIQYDKHLPRFLLGLNLIGHAVRLYLWWHTCRPMCYFPEKVNLNLILSGVHTKYST